MFWNAFSRGYLLIYLFIIFWGPGTYFHWNTLWREVRIKRKRHLVLSARGKSLCFSGSNGKSVAVSSEGDYYSIQWWRRSWPTMLLDAQLQVSIVDQRIWESIKEASAWLVTLAFWYSMMVHWPFGNTGGYHQDLKPQVLVIYYHQSFKCQVFF